MPSIDLASPGGDRDDVTPDSIGYAIGEGRGADLGTPVRHPAGGGGCQPRRRPCRASDRPPPAAASDPDGDAVMLPRSSCRTMAGWRSAPTTAQPTAPMPAIRRHIPGVRFAHNPARRAADVVASLWDVRQRYPESWGRLGGLDDMARLCNRHLRIAQSIRGRHDTFIMLYNDLIAHNAATLETLAAPPRRSSARPCQPDMCQAAVGPRHGYRRVSGRAGRWGRCNGQDDTMIRVRQITAELLQGDTTSPSNDDPAVSPMP